MKEACRFYSLLLPLKQHQALQAISRKNEVPLSRLVREGISLLIKAKSEKQATSGD